MVDGTLTRVILHTEEPDSLRQRLREEHPSIQIETCNSYEGLPDLISSFRPDCVYSIRFAGSKGFPRESLFSKAGPRWIHIGGSGTDHLGTWDPSKVTVTNSAGVAASMMAEFTIGCMLHFSLDIPGLQTEKAKRSWNPRSLTPLKGKTVLIVGLGKTGKAVAKLCKAIGMKTVGIKSRPETVPYVDIVEEPEKLFSILPSADNIVVSVPLLASTRYMFDAVAFSNVKPGAILIDLSRGGIVRETALVEALRSGTLKAAALDVFETEPLPQGSPLWELENLLISPHSSSVFDGWELESLDIFAENLGRFLAGEPLNNVVDPDRGY